MSRNASSSSGPIRCRQMGQVERLSSSSMQKRRGPLYQGQCRGVAPLDALCAPCKAHSPTTPPTKHWLYMLKSDPTLCKCGPRPLAPIYT